MDAASDAVIAAYKIGPTSLLGRAAALRILYLPSIPHLRRHIRRILSALVAALAALHPSNARGVLIAVTLLAFLLKRSTTLRSRTESAYRRKFWGNLLKTAVTYDEWAHAARMLEKETSGGRRSDAELYDEELVRNKLRELRLRREEGSLRDVVFCMRADLVRNLGNMCNPKLHNGRLQVPKLMKEYIDEVSTQLRMICDSEGEDLTLEEKLAFMHETRHAYGRTALLLSGGASLGAFHVGVVKTLVEHKLLPRIIAGSSVGSIICSIVATRSWPELETFFEDNTHSLQFFDQLGGIFTAFRRIMTLGALHDITQLQRMLRHLTSNLTFQEAYDMTGRVLGITVCSPRKHEPPRCLNYLTSPHVVIWSAVTASCAFPGLFEAQELMAKDRFGDIVPFHAPFLDGPEEAAGSARRWRDGSLEIDLPMIQLKELFNVNHFIVSQANPHIAPLLRIKELVTVYGGNFAAKLANLVEMEVKHRCNQILELGFPLGGIAKLFAQDWEGDVTIVMPATLSQYCKIIQNPTFIEIQKAANQGRRCTWEKLSAIKANCVIELALDECVARLNHLRRLKRNAARAAASQVTTTLRLNPSRRIPSWVHLGRENSASSIEEFLTDAAASIHQITSQQHAKYARSVHDGSDSESESIDLHSWTRSGGPLMRTASATKFIQDLEIEPESSNRNWQREEENEGSASTQSSTNSIIVSEGDLLQPERIHNGIVLNVVRREVLNQANRAEDPEQFQAAAAPDVVVDSEHMESCDASIDSECSDECEEIRSSYIEEATSHGNEDVASESNEVVQR